MAGRTLSFKPISLAEQIDCTITEFLKLFFDFILFYLRIKLSPAGLGQWPFWSHTGRQQVHLEVQQQI